MGTRPEVIKMAPVVWELKKHPREFETLTVVTAQHREMVDQMMRIFELQPDIDLNLMEHNQSPSRLMSRAVAAVDDLLRDLKPDLVLVQGDTTTVLAVSLAAFFNRVSVGHVEAGLRSFDKLNPYPEEINRRIASMVADWHFAPTQRAKENLLNEGVESDRVHVTGNTVVDSLLRILSTQPDVPPAIADVGVSGRKLILVTAHRRENHGGPLSSICQALCNLVDRNPEIDIVYPVHPNPNVGCLVKQMTKGHPRIHLIAPIDYPTMVGLMNQCYLILTDSGGIQEEAPCLKKPVLVLRDVTERPEALEAGVARLVGTETHNIVCETEKLIRNSDEYKAMAQGANPYGDGKAAARIVSILARSLCD